MSMQNARFCRRNARVHLFGRREPFEVRAVCRKVEVAMLCAAISAKPEELGYGW
jgi:hypothetical protein